MKINMEIILNVWIAMFIYSIVFASIGKVLITYFLDHSKSIQEAKKTFNEKLADKAREKEQSK